jgi:hypothetical protein
MDMTAFVKVRSLGDLFDEELIYLLIERHGGDYWHWS